MCGIVGYVGHRPACDVVVDALRRMEYRGYDSAGVALDNGRGTLTVRRRAGRLANLEAALDATDPVALSGHSGVGHTRWATHGRPTDRNAHPHSDATVKIAVVHNGIIENFAALPGQGLIQRRGQPGKRMPASSRSSWDAHGPTAPQPHRTQRGQGRGLAVEQHNPAIPQTVPPWAPRR